MSKGTVDNIGDGIEIHKFGSLVTKVTKNGVVLWPQEPHNAGMLTDTPLTATEIQKMNEEREYLRLRFPPATANARQEGGDHYRNKDTGGTCPTCKNPVQHWDWAHNLRGLEYAATKYIARWRDKGGLESLKKAIHYTQKLIEIHFPDVVITVQYTNKPEANGLRRNRREEADAGQGLAESAAPYQTSLERGDS